MVEMTLIEVDVNDLIPYENNPRKNEKAVAAVAASIREFGFLRPIIVEEALKTSRYPYLFHH